MNKKSFFILTTLSLLHFLIGCNSESKSEGKLSHSETHCNLSNRNVDATKTFTLCKKLAEQGNADAQHSLGQMYDKGQGVAKDKTQAFQWYQKTADQGNVLGQVKLGRMYRLGEGVDKDETQAFQWYKKSAVQGDAGGQTVLGFMYEFGKGVETDFEVVDLIRTL